MSVSDECIAIFEKAVDERTDRGIEALFNVDEDWTSKVNLGELSILSGDKCILGQVSGCGEYSTVWDRITDLCDYSCQMHDFGFYRDDGVVSDYRAGRYTDFDYCEHGLAYDRCLEAAWKRKITALREAAPVA